LVGRVLVSPYRRGAEGAPEPVRILQVGPKEDVEHVFPLLRVLQLRESLRRRGGGAGRLGDVAGAREYLFSVIHRQLSESQLADGEFDPAELVFALEGWLVTADGGEPDRRVVDRVFEVMADYQERVPYWHPFKPFKATAQGLVLLPQSGEIANSLLRICSTSALRQHRYFDRHASLLTRYRERSRSEAKAE
jgi:hypothetical protein